MPLAVIRQMPSVNFSDRKEGTEISILVMHYTGMKSGGEALQRLCDPDAGVSAHYLIEEDGTVFQMVAEDKRAWHAGAGIWRGYGDVNSVSVGIEIVNPGHEFGYRPFPDRQMQSVLEISKAVIHRHKIKPFNVIAHSDMAPSRKADPGELFNWRWLAENGIGFWPDMTSPIDKPLLALEDSLKNIGYDITDMEKTIAAFQRRWRPEQVDGVADRQTTELAYMVQKEVRRLT